MQYPPHKIRERFVWADSSFQQKELRANPQILIRKIFLALRVCFQYLFLRNKEVLTFVPDKE